MSGRIHIFLYKEVREKLEGMAKELDMPIEDDSLGHLLQEGAKYVFRLKEEDAIPEEMLKDLKAPREVITRLERKVRCFLSNGTIKNMSKLAREWDIDLFDTVFGHFMQVGFLAMHSAWKTGAPKFLTKEDYESMKTVYQPKVVYHR